MIEYDDLLENYNTIWDKVSTDIKKEFDSESVYNKEYLKTKIKSNGDEVTDFYDKNVPKVDSNHTCLAVISLDSALKEDGNYYLQVLFFILFTTFKYTIKIFNKKLSAVVIWAIWTVNLSSLTFNITIIWKPVNIFLKHNQLNGFFMMVVLNAEKLP